MSSLIQAARCEGGGIMCAHCFLLSDRKTAGTYRDMIYAEDMKIGDVCEECGSVWKSERPKRGPLKSPTWHDRTGIELMAEAVKQEIEDGGCERPAKEDDHNPFLQGA